VGFNIGRINGRLLELELSALEQKQQVEIIASPRLLASHMQPASIKQGSEIRIRSPAAKAAPPPLSLKRRYWEWRSRRRSATDRVRLKLHISENTPGQVLQQENGEALAIDKQEIETQVEVKSGERWRWAESFRRKTKPSRDSVPLLGHPWLGQLFATTVKITNGVNWLSSLHHVFWQCINAHGFARVQVFDVRTDLAYKGYRFESRDDINPPYPSGDLFSCQTSRSIEIIFSLTLALLHMRFQFMSCYAGCLRSGFTINE
jgi:hypothetical protein